MIRMTVLFFIVMMPSSLISIASMNRFGYPEYAALAITMQAVLTMLVIRALIGSERSPVKNKYRSFQG